jgi:hypothetical protein
MAMKQIACAAIPFLMAAMPTQAVTVEQLNQQVQQMNKRIAKQDNKLRINGFASFGMAISDEEMAYNGVTDEASFNRFSKMGVQMSFNLDENNSVVTQLVSRGENNWNTQAEWAYFKHNFGSGFSSKVGRIRTPAYMLSEYLDVGYAVPWAQMPAESYSSLTPFSNMDGFDLTYSTDVGDNIATVQFAYGRSADDEYDLKDIIGLSATFQADTWSTRLAYAASSLTVLDATLKQAVSLYGEDPTEVDSSFTSLGFTYDPGDIYFTTEYTKIEVDGVIVDADAVYASLGYRMGRLMPIFTYGMTESQDDDEREVSQAAATATAAAIGGGTTAADILAGAAQFQANNNRNTQRIGLGLRYDMAAGTALKVQYDIIEVDDEAGLFDPTPFAAAGTSAPDGTNILTISIDTVF